MLIHIIKESIPAFSELGIKMFLPSTEWRPVSANPQFGLLPAITGTLYVSFIAVVLALIFGVACACFLNFYLPEKIAAVFLAFIDLVAGIPSVIFGFIGQMCIRDRSKIDKEVLKKTLKGIITNPIIIGIVVGLLWLSLIHI